MFFTVGEISQKHRENLTERPSVSPGFKPLEVRQQPSHLPSQCVTQLQNSSDKIT